MAAADIIRIAENQGLLDTILRSLLGVNRNQMERDGLTEIIRTGTCRKFSKATGRMIFCDKMLELRNGKLSLSEAVGSSLRITWGI
jgi:hypothetical protein